ncbi:MAG: hypothetical protein U9P38_02360 [Campylobacterota bacterium]|nr:hypothetical protein [Campylobacterota bacterium]
MIIKNKLNSLSHGREGKPKIENRINIFRWFYFLLLIVIFSTLLDYLLSNFYLKRATGVVTTDKIEYPARFDGVLQKIDKQKGDIVDINETLFTVVSVTLKEDDIAKKLLLDTKNRIEKIKAQIAIDKELLHFKTKKLIKLKKFSILELYDKEKQEIKSLEAEILKIKIDIKLLRVDLVAYKNILKSITVTNKTVRVKNYLSKYKAEVQQVLKNESEYVKKGEPVMVLEKPQSTKIIAYFRKSYIESLEIGKEVTILFPDNTKSLGIIKDYYSQLLSNDYKYRDAKLKDPTSFKVIIEAKNKEDIQRWKKFSHIRVKIRIYEWF